MCRVRGGCGGCHFFPFFVMVMEVGEPGFGEVEDFAILLIVSLRARRGGAPVKQAVAVTIAGRRASGMGLRGVCGGGLGGGEGGSGEGWVRTQRGARLWFAGAACGYFFSAAASATSARDERCVHPRWRRGVGNEPWRGGRCAAPRRRLAGVGRGRLGA